MFGDAYSNMPNDQAQALRRSAAIRLAREKRKNALERERIAAQVKVAGMQEKPALMRSRAALTQAATGARQTNLQYGPKGTVRAGQQLTGEELARRFPYQAPQYKAETGRINALAAKRRAGATAEWSSAQAKRDIGELALEQENKTLGTSAAVPTTETIVNGLAKKLKKKPGLGTNTTETSAPGSSLMLTDWLSRILGY